MAEAGVGSRRACEELIELGEVRVNGHLVTDLPAFVSPVDDVITVSGKRIRSQRPVGPGAGGSRGAAQRTVGAAPIYVMLYKPKGVVCTNRDPEGRKRAIDLVRHPSKARLYPVGRLDLDSSGLLLMTNDGELANRLTHPRYEMHKTYEVTVKGSLSPEDVKRLEHGVFLPDRRNVTPAGDDRAAPQPGSKTRRSRLKIMRRDRERTRLLMELREGRNRQIRRVMARLGYPVKKLHRVQIGPLKLRDLRPGQWRDLLPRELTALRKAAASSTDAD